jgi:ferritin-like metal-binding protein YciE
MQRANSGSTARNVRQIPTSVRTPVGDCLLKPTSSMSIETQFANWLQEAYLMETRYLGTLQGHLKDAEEHPRLHRLIEEHLIATANHVYEVRQCLERLEVELYDLGHASINPSIGFGASSTEIRQDRVVNNTIVELVNEHYEIARYITLISAATNLGDLATAQTCEAILEDEEAMAEKLTVELPEITSVFLELSFLRQQGKWRNHSQPSFSSMLALRRFAAISG